MIGLHVTADALFAVSYWLIPAALWMILQRRKDIAFQSTFVPFALFIVACGTNHLMNIVTLWEPVYRLQALEKLAGGGISLFTTIVLFRLVPRIVALPSPAMLREEMARRQAIERELRVLNDSLEQRVSERSAMVDAVLESLPVSIIIAGPDGRLVSMNRASKQIWGEIPETKSIAEYAQGIGYRPESDERIAADDWPLTSAVVRGDTVTGELVEIARFGDHERRTLELSAAPVRDRNGSLLGGVMACLDVTERLCAEKALRESEATLSAVLDALPVAVAIADTKGALVRNNAAVRELWGISPDTGSWKEYGGWVGYWPETGQRIQAQEWAMSRALLSGEVTKGELIEYERFDTHERRMMINNAAPVRDAGGKIIGAVAAEMDVTAWRQTEQALQQTHAELEAMLNSIPDPVIVVNAAGNVVRTNNVFETRHLAAEPSDVAGYRPHVELFTEDGQSVPYEMWPLNRALRGEAVHGLILRLQFRNGAPFYYRHSAAPIYNRNGRIAHAVLTCFDVSEQKRAEQGLRESEARFRAVFQSAAVGVARVAFEGAKWLEVNDAFCRILGYSRDELIGQPWPAITHPDDIDKDLQPFKRMAKGEIDTYTVEKRFIHKTGHNVWARLTSSLVRDRFGLPDFEVCLLEDISERKQAEDALRESEERFRTLAEAVPNLLWSMDANGECNYVSPRFEEYTGMRASDLLGHFWISALHPDDRQAARSAWSDAYSKQQTYEVEYRIRRFDGNYLWFVARAVPMFGSDGGVKQWLGSCTEVDSLKRTEGALRRSNEDLRQFAFAAAHDLQEPLRNVSLAVGMLRRRFGDYLSDACAPWADAAVEGAQRMHDMVKDLLTYSRVVDDTDQQEFVKPVAVSAALAIAVANLNETIAETDAQIWVGELPLVMVREVHLVQIFQSLISNSLKYRKEGVSPEISISAQLHATSWQFCVADNGIGFAPEYAEKIFGVFKRLHTRDKYSGNGIGLALCARVVAHYGGRIWAYGEPRCGAKFYFTLPG